jgi:rhodanese-related sulfurtransferase
MFENLLGGNKLQDTDKAAKHFECELNCVANPHSVQEALQKKEKIIIIDVRDEKSYKDGHIPGAINLPYDKYQTFSGDQEKFKELDHDRFTYVYCYDLYCNLSQKAALKFAKLGYPVKEIKGGFEAWKQKGYNVVTLNVNI